MTASHSRDCRRRHRHLRQAHTPGRQQQLPGSTVTRCSIVRLTHIRTRTRTRARAHTHGETHTEKHIQRTHTATHAQQHMHSHSIMQIYSKFHMRTAKHQHDAAVVLRRPPAPGSDHSEARCTLQCRLACHVIVHRNRMPTDILSSDDSQSPLKLAAARPASLSIVFYASQRFSLQTETLRCK